MKTILRKTSTLLAAVLLLGSCIKETEPTSVATPDQINKNSAALEATITGICSALHKNYSATTPTTTRLSRSTSAMKRWRRFATSTARTCP